MTAEKLDGDDEKYEYEYCLCGAIKRHKYTYEDSLSNSQTETWTETTDDLGRKVKEYYPYPIAVEGSDEYHSLLYEYDTASRRKLYSDPTFGHTCGDTSGWTDDTEPHDEENWVLNEPQRYLYGMKGGLEATGRVASSEIMASQGEPYFVQRDGAGRIAKVVYPDDDTTEVPQIEWQYTYGGDGRVKQVAAVKTTNADDTTYGPQKYVVQFFHDDVGRLVRKVVRDNAKQDTISTHYESKLEYDGRGQMVREQIIKFDAGSDRMQVMSDIQTTYDLGRNPITIKVYDKSGWAYTETRTYARGHQLTGFSTSAAADVTISTHGSYTYDTNNNLTTTKKLDASRGGNQLAYRAEWTFTYDRKNRLKSHANTNASNVRGNLWYDGRGRVWQRWNDNSNTEDWDGTLLRFVYDGSTLAQEHNFDVAEVLNAWVYTYDDLTRDYLRQPGGTRQRERSGGNDTDYFLQANQGTLEYKVERSPVSETYARTERKSSLDQLPDSTFNNISNLATPNGYIEMYGGSTSGSTAGFDGLVHMGGRHYLAGLGRKVNAAPDGGSSFLGEKGSGSGFSEGCGSGGCGAYNPQSPVGFGGGSGNGPLGGGSLLWTPGEGWEELTDSGSGASGHNGLGGGNCGCGAFTGNECCCLLVWKCTGGKETSPFVPCVLKDPLGICWQSIDAICRHDGHSQSTICNIDIATCLSCDCCKDEAEANAHIPLEYSDWNYYACIKNQECYPHNFYRLDTEFAEKEWGFHCEKFYLESLDLPDSGLTRDIILWLIGHGASWGLGKLLTPCSNIEYNPSEKGLPGSQVMFYNYDYCNCSGLGVGF
jgi:hypothetical protein